MNLGSRGSEAIRPPHVGRSSREEDVQNGESGAWNSNVRIVGDVRCRSVAEHELAQPEHRHPDRDRVEGRRPLGQHNAVGDDVKGDTTDVGT